MTKTNALFTIEELKRKITPYASKYGIKTLWIFGSYARGDADVTSDVDVMIDCGVGRIQGMLTYLSFVYDLERELNCHVDVVTTNVSDKGFTNAIIPERILIYEEQGTSRPQFDVAYADGGDTQSAPPIIRYNIPTYDSEITTGS